MKIRTDFVTNSSSSSFIFGTPNKNTIQISDVVSSIKDKAQRVFNVVELLDNMLLAIPDINTYVEKLRNGSTDYKDEMYIRDFIESRKDIYNTVRSWLDQNDIDEDTEEFLFCYTNNSSVETIRNITESTDKWSLPWQSRFIDLRESDKNDTGDIISSLYWFEDSLSDKAKSEIYRCRTHRNSDDTSDVASIAHKYLGEVMLVGECGYIPDILVQMLYTEAHFGCNHMG